MAKRTPTVAFIVPRLILVGLLLVALINPTIPGNLSPSHLIVVLDESLSMPADEVAAAWPRIAEMVRELPPGARFSLVRYGTAPTAEVSAVPVAEESVLSILNAPAPPPARLPLDRSSTNTESALQQALHLASPANGAAILLVSDGRDTEGDAASALRLARDAGVPVYLLDVDGRRGGHDYWIEHMHVPARARAGESVVLSVTVAGNTRQSLAVRVAVDGRPVSEAPAGVSPPRPTAKSFVIPMAGPGVHEVEVSLVASDDAVPENNRRTRLITVEPPAPILFVTSRPGDSPIAGSLAAGGRLVEQVSPSGFPQSEAVLEPKSAIVLDDVAIDDMTGDAWKALAAAVRGRGTGLVVLGGPNSFAAGSYRGSLLESLLPVTAESGRPDARAAVLFLVDKSGSMERGQHGASRFSFARKAVRGTAKTLGKRDLAGLIWFDKVARVGLPLESYGDPVGEIEKAWRLAPGGGTVLTPALRAGIDHLSRTEAEQRLLVLVTDGFVSPGEELERLALPIGENGINLISLVVGENLDVDRLRQLSTTSGGLLVRIDQVSRLPRIMRREVEMLRNPVQLGPLRPRQVAPPPFVPEVDTWPVISGYMVTKARPRATVYLESDRGDPLLAAHHVGTARVAALPSGLGGWAGAWHDWPLWGQFLGGLLEWVSARNAAPFLHARIEDTPARLLITVDAVGRDFEWDAAAEARAVVQGPGGGTQEVVLEEVAPGRYTGSAAIRQTGRYRASVRIGDRLVGQDILHSADHEFVPGMQAEARIADLLDQGLLRRWTPGSPIAAGAADARPGVPVRAALLPAVFVLYVLLLGYERAGFQMARIRRLVAIRRSRNPSDRSPHAR